MSVKGLEYYLKREVRGGISNVNIKNEISKWKENNQDRDPIIVIGFLSRLIFYINQREFDESVCGGRNSLLFEEVCNFFHGLRTCGAKLVFFERAYKDEYWNVSDCSIYRENSSEIVKTAKIRSSRECETLLGLDVESIANEFGELKYSYSQPFPEILDFIKRTNNVLAILAKEPQFLISDLDRVQYWSCDPNFLNLQNFNTKVFHIDAFLHGFSREQKAVFGSLVQVHYEQFKDDFNQPLFEKRRLESHEKPSGDFKRIRVIADYVRGSMLVNQPDVPNILEDAFNIVGDQELESILREYYNNYAGTGTNVENEENLNELYFTSAKSYPIIYNILFNRAICLPPYDFAMVNLNQWNEGSTPYTDLILPIYKRIAGIILKHKGDENITFKIVASAYHLAKFNNAIQMPEYPSNFTVEFLNLDTLIFETNENDIELNGIKWRLVFWTLGITFDDLLCQHIRQVGDDLKPVLLILCFLRQEQQISIEQADTILISEMDQINGRIGVRRPVPRNPNGIAVRVAQLYVQTRNILNHCFRACGLQEYARTSDFDGVYFQELFVRYQNRPLYEIALNGIRDHRVYA